MNPFTLLTPPKVLFGCGCFGDIGAEAASLGRRALVVTGRSAMRRAGITDRCVEALAAAGCGASVFEDVEHDPSLNTVERGREAARRTEADVVIGIGGGSPLDAAKAVAILANKPGAASDYFHGRREINAPGLPLIAVATTSGTGAEITKNAVLTDTSERVKKSFRHALMVARVAIVDPELTVSCGPNLTAHSGMDALTQAIECYVSRAAQPVSDVLALSAAKLLYEHLVPAVEDGANIEHREAMALGSMTCGLAFANASLGAVHGLAHPIGAELGLAHGLVCAALLAPVVAFNYRACRDKMDHLARTLGLASGADLAPALRNLADRVGIPRRLGSLALREEVYPAILASCRSGSMSNNPREASDEDILGILDEVGG